MSHYYAVEFTDTLMRLQDDGYVQSGDRTATYCFRIPDAWVDDHLQEKIFAVAEKLYAEYNARFQENEPSDPNYIKVLKTFAFPFTATQVADKIRRNAPAPAVWEWTPCFDIQEDGTFTRVTPSEF